VIDCKYWFDWYTPYTGVRQIQGDEEEGVLRGRVEPLDYMEAKGHMQGAKGTTRQ